MALTLTINELNLAFSPKNQQNIALKSFVCKEDAVALLALSGPVLYRGIMIRPLDMRGLSLAARLLIFLVVCMDPRLHQFVLVNFQQGPTVVLDETLATFPLLAESRSFFFFFCQANHQKVFCPNTATSIKYRSIHSDVCNVKL